MKLKKILSSNFDDKILGMHQDLDITNICVDSRKACAGSLFVALKGVASDGNDYINHAIENGAIVVVSDSEKCNTIESNDALVLKVESAKELLRDALNNFYNHPSEKVKTVGITGTNGKTTVSYLCESILQTSGLSCSVIGTINYRIGERIIPSINTTPGVLENQILLNDIADDGVEYCVMEVSSHALDQGRVDLVDFKTAVFTNLTSDHLDYHETLTNYFEAKSLLFKNLTAQAHAVINIDDVYGRKLISRTDAKVLTYAIDNKADIMAHDIQIDLTGTKFRVTAFDQETIFQTKLIGKYNVYNILAAVGVGISEGLSLDKIKRGVEHINCVPGRLESMECGQKFSIFIDYAHTADALENVLNMFKDTSDAKLTLVFGCGGDRDKSKRPEMGRIATQLADQVIITSDNPRSEDPNEIIEDILKGVDSTNYVTIVNREEAIKEALKKAKPAEIVLIAGKGHENYQTLGNQSIPFNEKQIIRDFILC